MANAPISQITLPSGTTYDIVDAGARSLIDEMSSYTDFLGVTTTALSDGATTNPITINNASVTAVKGNIVTYGSSEFIFNGTSWQAFGDLSGLGDLAYKDTASGTGTMSGIPATFRTECTPAAKEVSVTGTPTGTVNLTTSKVPVTTWPTGDTTYTPAGTINKTSGKVTVSATATGTGSTYAPEGTIVPTRSNVEIKTTASGTASYTPEGTISPNCVTDVQLTTNNNMYMASSADGGMKVTAGTAASFTATVANGVLTLGWTANTPTAVTKPTFVKRTFATGSRSLSTQTPTFTGTTVHLATAAPVMTSAEFQGTRVKLATDSEVLTDASFTGTGVRLLTAGEVATDASFTGNEMTSTGNYVPATGVYTTTVATTTSKTFNVTVS